MKRLILLTLIIAASAWLAPVFAQTDLNIAEAFEMRFRDLPESTETMLIQNKVRDVDVALYRILTIVDHPELADEIEKMVMRDGAKSVSKEVRYASGHLYYGFYALTKRAGLNRYILYLNTHLRNGNKVMLLYIESHASTDKIKKLINNK